MGKNQKTSHKLQPEDRFSGFPKTTAFILYRIYPIGSVSLMLYLAHTGIVLDWYQLKRFWIIFIIAVLLCLSGMWYGRKYHGSKLEESGSRQAWLDTINSNIEEWVKRRGPGPNFRCLRSPESNKRSIQNEKEAFSAYLAGSSKGMPLPYSPRESCFYTAIIFGYLYGGIRLTLADELPLSVTSSVIVLCTLFFLFFLGRMVSWFGLMGRAARKIRKECKRTDMEKGEDTKRQLEWWIEAILKE
jgi:hypothetical protein